MQVPSQKIIVLALMLASATVQAQLTNPSKASSSTADSAVLKDYVPCLMQDKTLNSMHGEDGIEQPLDSATVVSRKSASAVYDFLTEKATTPSQKNAVTTAKGAVTGASTQPTLQSLEDVVDAFGLDEAPKNKLKQQVKQKVEESSSFPVPSGIGCSMSVFPWDISHMVFGRTVADHYLAVQVVVRNLDQDHEFLIHDAELAVDATSAQLARFQASHEKEAVRGVLIYGQTYDRRAVWSHVLEGIGIIGGAIVGLPQPSIDQLTAASGAYTAGFLPSFQKLFPDLTTSNLNNLNDLGFSAASASRIVVPKGGAVPFVVFVPVRPLEQACWLQPGYNPLTDDGTTTACTGVTFTPPAAGVKPSKNSGWREVKFKDWPPLALTALQKHAFAVIAGVHIQQLSATPSIRSISCLPADSVQGILIASVLAAKQPLTCTLVGASLDTVAKLRLKDSTTTTSPTTIDGTVTSGVDATTAQAVFASGDIAKFTSATYAVFTVDKSNTETDMKQLLTVVPAPTVMSSTSTPVGSTAASTSAIALNVGFNLALVGTNLDQVKQVSLTQGATTVTSTSQSGATTAMTAVFPKNTLAAGTYEIILVVGSDSKTQYDSGQSVTYK